MTLSTDNYKAAVAERNRIEHERDYDALTGLYSRQAFFRVCGELFEKPDTLRHAALMMTDLDNLKTINDTYGHDWGDIYLRQTAHSLRQNSPGGTVVARLSGDEFLLLFYGYETQEALRADIKKLEENFAQSSAALPDGKRLCIRMSGGVAWYPEDALDLDTLKKYADFAMYEVKHSTKARYGSSTWSATAPVSMRWSSAATLKNSSGSGGWTTTSSPSSQLTTAMWWPMRPDAAPAAHPAFAAHGNAAGQRDGPDV